MYALLSALLILGGILLLAVVFIRKMPILASLPEEEEPSSSSLTAKVRERIARIDWKRWKRLILKTLAFIAGQIFWFFRMLARKIERLVHDVNRRIQNLSEGKTSERKRPPFFSRIRKRAAYVEEERRLIEQLSKNPKDIEAYRRLGNLYVIAGNIADARASFSEILRLNPDDEEAKRRLSELG
jgi:tetratricopeptide (TPR) repeat protein